MMTVLPPGLLLLAVTLALAALGPTAHAAGPRPAAFLHLATRRATSTEDQPMIGKCTHDEAVDLFRDYSESCTTMIANLIDQFDGDNADSITVGELYAVICSDECRKPIEEFRDRCDDTSKLTGPILSACDQELGGQCIARLSESLDVATEVARTCGGAVATETCTQDCRDSLEKLRVTFSCPCIDGLFRKSTYGYDTLGLADRRLWALCGASLLGECDSSSELADAENEDLVSRSAVGASGSILVTLGMLCVAALNWL